MAELIVGAVLIMLLVRILGHGVEIEWDDIAGIPQLAALAGLVCVLVLCFFRAQAFAAAGEIHYPALGMIGLAACGLLLIWFPERMPDTASGGTPLTAFWAGFGWLLLGLSFCVVVALRPG